MEEDKGFMTVAQLIEALGLKLLTPETDTGKTVSGGCVCDLLSFVMAKGEAGMAWITVQTHMNVIAVASLHEFSCIIVAEGCEVEEETLAKAKEEDLPVLHSELSGYALAGKLYGLGIH